MKLFDMLIGQIIVETKGPLEQADGFESLRKIDRAIAAMRIGPVFMQLGKVCFKPREGRSLSRLRDIDEQRKSSGLSPPWQKRQRGMRCPHSLSPSGRMLGGAEGSLPGFGSALRFFGGRRLLPRIRYLSFLLVASSEGI